MPGSPKIKTTVVDASVLINLLHVERLDFLIDLPGYEFIIPAAVVAEITDAAQAARLNEFIVEKGPHPESLTSIEELELFAELRQVLGRGESACLALAKSRGWYVACDEKGRFLRWVRDNLGHGRLINTAGMILLAIRSDLLSVEEADRLKGVLEEHRYKMTFTSFRELLGGKGTS